MKQAIMILAHANMEQVADLIGYFSEQCVVFLHIDKKCQLTDKEYNMLSHYPQTKGIYQTIDVHWGGYSLLMAEIDLMRHAYEKSDADYFHLLSGQDYPIVPLHVFLDFFDINNIFNYIDCQSWSINEWQDSRFDRYRYSFPFDEVDAHTAQGNSFVQESIRNQITNCMQRPPFSMFSTIYKGSQWFSITRKAVHYILDYTISHPDFFLRLKDTFAPEETYINTLLCNRPDLFPVYQGNLRYIRWTGENGNNPSHLGIEHLDDIATSNKLFARKMVYPLCSELISEINCKLLRL